MIGAAPERDVLPVAERHGLGVIVWSPLAGGWLAGKYRRGEGPPPDSRAVRFAEQGRPVVERYDLSRPGNQRKLDVVEALSTVADEAGVSLTAMSIAFTLAHAAVTSTIIGPRTPQQLDQLLSYSDVRLDQGMLDAIDAIMSPGTLCDESDRGWDPPWMSASARRR